MERLNRSFRTYSLPVLSGILLALCFPKADLGWLAWFALIPAFIGNEHSFKRWYACGLTFFLVLLYWIYPTCRAGEVAAPIAALATFSLCAFLALQFGAFGYIISSPHGRGPGAARGEGASPLFAAAVWVTLELFRERVLGFPWELVGYSQWRYPILLQITSITGIHGLSFLIVWTNAALAEYLSQRERSAAGRVRGLLPPAVAVAFTLIFGAVLLNKPDPVVPPLRIALLQGNIDQYKKWDSAFEQEIKFVYQDLVKAAAPKADLLIWPESAAPGWLEDPAVNAWLAGLARETAKPNLIGVVARNPTGVVNGALVYDAGGRPGPVYAKRHLVPFGEYVPLQDFLGRWAPILTTLGGVSAGTDAAPLSAGPLKLGANVCYEIVFPEEVRQTVALGAAVLANVTNDGWYLDTAGPYQHLSMSAVRAVENRRPLLRAANTGVSAVFDSRGRLQQTLGINERGFLTATVFPVTGQTFFTRFGEIFAWLCVLGSLLSFMRGGLGWRAP